MIFITIVTFKFFQFKIFKPQKIPKNTVITLVTGCKGLWNHREKLLDRLGNPKPLSIGFDTLERFSLREATLLNDF